MDKIDFIKLAPQYYAVAICATCHKTDVFTLDTVDEIYGSGNLKSGYRNVPDTILLEEGLKIAEQLGIVRIVRDPFGPKLITASDDYSERWTAAKIDPASPFQSFDLASHAADDWLKTALASIRSEYSKHQVEPDDFAKEIDEWEPIPLDRDDDNFKAATAALETTIEELRADNGYSVAHPQEKGYVIDKLSQARKRLNEEVEISWMYLREFVFKPLGILIKRFGSAAIGMTATTARDALITWLKSKGVGLLDELFR